jgi:hypothetical protein
MLYVLPKVHRLVVKLVKLNTAELALTAVTIAEDVERLPTYWESGVSGAAMVKEGANTATHDNSWLKDGHPDWLDTVVLKIPSMAGIGRSGAVTTVAELVDQ